ncbi:SRPBCC family protein [Nocardia sp. NPDC051570]|uniref:SRPBCC family protein n=1 Tax=Nocardia sp. NPDC051570 TaxID=3364324 RepID=UPI00379C4006
MSRIFQTRSELAIAATPDAIFDTVTDPDRWPRAHPACLAVERTAAGPAPAKTLFTEVVGFDADTLAVRWRVDNCRRPCRWVISSRTTVAPRLGDFTATMTVVYSVTDTGSGHQLLRRSMVTAVDTDAGIARPLLDLFGGNAWHDAHLAAVKRTVETR